MESLFTGSLWGILALVLLFAWSFAWKGVALWKSSRNDQKVWFIVLLIINTVGILEIIYIFAFSKKKPQAS
jgi:hypothetical protein